MQNSRNDMNDRYSYSASGSSKTNRVQGNVNRSTSANQGAVQRPQSASNPTSPSRPTHTSSGQSPQHINTPRANTQPANTRGAISPQSTSQRSANNSRTAVKRTSSQGVSRSQAVGSVRSRSVSAGTTKKKSALDFWKRTFAVDRTLLEQRAIVREQGSYDYVFLILVLVLLAFGTVMVYSASYAYSKFKYNDSYYIIFRQFIFIVVGFIGMGFAMWFRPEWYKKFAVPIYIICFLLLCVVPIPGIGRAHGGARRWISLGFTEIQPSEFMKLGIVLMLAWYFDRYYERVTDYKHFGRSTFFGVFTPLAIIGVTCMLIVIEKHLSCTIIMFLIGVTLMFVGGSNVKLLAALAGMGGVGLLLFALLTDYTKRRFDIWMHPEHDPRGDGYQTLQGLYAIGSGGFFGVGIGESRQKHMYVSQPQNDFIFTIVCEELGFVGAIAVVLLFIMFAWRGFIIALKAPDTFSSLVVIGIVSKVVLQALLNIAVVTNSIPNTGISLPFFSYGGSSLCILMVEMGIILSISRFSKQKK
ncbi:MAG: putative lipid II flippase FtsW [Clostridiales bacterium]|nr:putative lipid II flippase FtsW [Clostridiales bacterium]